MGVQKKTKQKKSSRRAPFSCALRPLSCLEDWLYGIHLIIIGANWSDLIVLRLDCWENMQKKGIKNRVASGIWIQTSCTRYDKYVFDFTTMNRKRFWVIVGQTVGSTVIVQMTLSPVLDNTPIVAVWSWHVCCHNRCRSSLLR